MADEIYTYPEQRSERPRGEMTAPATPSAAEGPRPDTEAPDEGAINRGQRARVTSAGEVMGSGASIGGSSAGEDIDSDAASGGGTVRMPKPPHPNSGGDGETHGSA